VAEATGDGPATDAEGAGDVDGVGADAEAGAEGLPALDPAEPLGTALGTGVTVQPDSAAMSIRLAARAVVGKRPATEVMTASILMVDMPARMRPFRLAVATLAGVLVLGACGAGQPSGDTPTATGEQVHCDLLAGARRTVDYHLSLLLALDDPAAIEELSGSDAPFRVDPGAFRTAVEALSVLSGTEGEMDRLRRIGQLLEEHAGVEDPLTPGSDTGEQLAELANGAFGEVRVGLDTALQAVGCRVR